MLTLAVLFSLLQTPLANAVPAVDERPIGAVVTRPAPFANGEPSVASDGTDFFVVWRDSRDGSAILASRIGHDGAVLESGIEIARNPAPGYPYHYSPQVLWNGSSYVVLWNSIQGDQDYTQQIWVARYDREGNQLQAPYMLAEKTRAPRTVAFNGSKLLVSFVEVRGQRPRAWLLDESAYPSKALLLADVEVTSSALMSSTAKGSDFLVVWDTVWDNEAQSFQIKGVPVSGSGDVQGGVRTLCAGGSAVVASDGTSYLLVYASRFGAYDTPWASRILSGDLSQISTERALPNLGRPVVLWRGDRYLAMGRNLGIIDRDGNSIAEPAPLVQSGQFTGIVSAAVNTTPRTLVAWTEATRGGNAAMARLYTGQTPVAAAPEFVISTSANRQIDPDIVHSRFGDLVAWREGDGVYATRVSPFGVAIDGRGIELSTEGDAGPPRVALHGTDYIVAWREENTVQLRWISATAGVQPQRVELEAGWDENADRRVGFAVTDDATYLTWTRDSRVQLARIPHHTRIAEGVPLAVSPEDVYAINPDVAFNGAELLVAWHEVTEWYGGMCGYPGEGIVGTTWAARVATNMTLLDTAPLRLGDNGDAYPHPISVASNGSDWLLSWLSVEHDFDTHLSKSWVVARRVLPNGTLEGDAPVRIGEGRASSLLWNGKDYAIAWKEDQSPGFVLRLGFINASGTPAIRNSVEVAATESWQDRFGLTLNGTRTAVVYSRMSRAPEHGRVERAFLRLFGATPKRRAVR